MRRPLLVGLAGSLGIALVVAACSDDDGGGPAAPDPSTVPEVAVTRPVGNPPVEGVVELVPRAMGPGESPWRFEIDLDGDGAADASGDVTGVTSVPFSFEAPGLHPVQVVFTRGTERVEVERAVNVLDPDRIEVLGTVQLDGGPVLEGIAVDRSGTRVFVSRSLERVLVKLEAATLTVQDTLRVSRATDTLEGLGVAPDEELIYIIDKSRGLALVELEPFEEVAFFSSPLEAGQFYVRALLGRRAYTGGEGNLRLIDAETGSVIRELSSDVQARLDHFAVSPSGDRVAAVRVEVVEANRLLRWSLVLTDGQLSEIGRSEAFDLGFQHVAWSPTGDRIYVRYSTAEGQRCGILVIDPEALEIVKNVPLSVDGDCSGDGVANPVASTPDGRFLVFPSISGAFVFDTAVDRPIVRTPISAGGGVYNFCCNVAASPVEDVFYIASFHGDVTTLRLLRTD